MIHTIRCVLGLHDLLVVSRPTDIRLVQYKRFTVTNYQCKWCAHSTSKMEIFSA